MGYAWLMKTAGVAFRMKSAFFALFLDELLLYSGQYALFYLLMNFGRSPLLFFANGGHTLLLATLLVQTLLLARFGMTPLPRFLLSLLAPAIYVAVESLEGPAFLLDMGHVFFWIFSLTAALLQAASRADVPIRRRMALEFAISVMNVAAFFAVYLYFDLRLGYEELQAAGKISEEEVRAAIGIENLGKGLASFVGDPAHVYVLLGGAFLALTIAVGRVKVLSLTARINELFGQYVDRSFRDEIISNDGGVSAERELCILFADIRNFTSLSEREEPSRVSQMLNRYFTEWDDLVSRYGGSVDKYIGDAVMAVFGVHGSPLACDDAVSCSIDMLHRLPALKAALAEAGLSVPDDIGIGIDYGKVIMGDLGSRSRKNYTVIGDHVNVASRLESLCKTYGSRCIVSDAVMGRLQKPNRDRFAFLGEASPKGKELPVRIYGFGEGAE